ncbi:flagellar biosynthesis anti-sigma factor FlgM [Aliikangiella maris]
MDIKSLVPGQTKANLGKADKTKKKTTTDATSASGMSDAIDTDDSVSLNKASQINQLVAQMKSWPAADQNRIAPVKEKVTTGKYEIEYERVADKMLDFESNYYGY